MINTEKRILSMIDKENMSTLEEGYNFRKQASQEFLGRGVSTERDRITDRFKFVYHVIFDSIRNIVKGKKINISGAILGNEDDLPERCSEIAEKFNEECIQIRRKTLYKNDLSLRYFMYWMRFVGLAILSFFDFRKVSLNNLSIVVDLCLKCVLLDKSVQTFYMFYLSDPYYYLLAVFIDRKCSANSRVMLGCNHIYENKYMNFYRSEVHLMSRFQNEEYKYYNEKGLIHVKNVVYFDDRARPYIKTNAQSNLIDIGYLSSGTWARANGRVRLNSAEEILENCKVKNKIWDVESFYFYKLCEYAKKNGLKLKLYPHPYERIIYKKYGLKTPLIECVDNVNIFIDEDEDKDSHSKFSEYNVGVSTLSTAIWQRDTYGFPNNFIYDYNLIISHPLYEKEAVGKYKEQFFSNSSELFNLLDSVLK